MLGQHRAIREEQKEERRQDILEAAWCLFQEMEYQAIAMSQVAERAGVAKGTVYLYFKTKEELFLSVYEKQIAHWFDDMDEGLQQAGTIRDLSQAVAFMCASLERRPAMTRLLAILHSLLEQNIDFDTALRFKRNLLARLQRTGAYLEAWLPFLPPGQGAPMLLRIYALVIGLWQLAEPAPVMRQVLQEPDMQLFRIGFSEELARTLHVFLQGLQNVARRKA